MSIIKDFLLQLALIATLIFTFQIFFVEKPERIRDYAKTIQAVLLGLAILLCMSFPAYLGDNIRLDIRVVPLLLGALYGGWRTGVFLSAMIILYRLYIGTDLGFYTTTATLVISMPIILFFQKYFTQAKKNRRIQIALLLSIFYGFVGATTGSLLRGFSFQILQVQFIYILISVAAVLLFTSLNETIKEMLLKNQRLKSAAKDAEISFLRSQINPHFLFNALNSIASLCIDEPHKAEELTLDLSQYLKSSFDFKQLDAHSTIESELELVKAYLNIEKARFGARLCVEYEIDADLDIWIPPLILQPLVENAIKHGLMTNLRGGTVKISIKKNTNAVVSFVVEDNGSGMSGQKREELLQPDAQKQGTGIGLWNISKRIELLYGKSIRIESAEGLGTKVFFDIPARPITRIGG